jgi:hypothetical protein
VLITDWIMGYSDRRQRAVGFAKASQRNENVAGLPDFPWHATFTPESTKSTLAV